MLPSLFLETLEENESMTVQILRTKVTVGQYHQMIESGILTDREPEIL